MELIIQMKLKQTLVLPQFTASSLFLVLFAALSVTPALQALPDDKNQPLNIVADKVTVNYAQGITHLEGNVTVTQGSTLLLGNQVIVYTDKSQQLLKLIAHGNTQQPASYETLPSPNGIPFQATANSITYISGEKLAIFSGDAHATDGTNQFTGPEFRYWTEKQEVIAEKIANQHSSIIIYPGSKHS